MKRSYVSEIERGLRNPTVRALGRLATALEVDPSVLLMAVEERQSLAVK
jgi:transcriptional regulator with XRE-family HTH domain